MRTFVIGFMGLVAACDGKSGGTVAYDEAGGQAYASAFCGCFFVGEPRSFCEQTVLAAFLANNLPAVQAGRFEVRREQWNECLDQMRDCAHGWWPACEEAVVGLLPKGAACVTRDECQEGLYCDFELEDPDTCQHGVCAPLRDLGEPCTFGGCAEQHVCVQREGGGSACEERRPIGAPCPVDVFVVDDYCQPHLVCVPGDDQEPVCGEPLPIGAPCKIVVPGRPLPVALDGGTFPNPCRSDAFCDVSTFVCRPRSESTYELPTRQQLGEACVNSRDLDVIIDELECDYDLTCVAGTCVAIQGNGAPCEQDDQCWGICLDGQCAARFECTETEPAD